MLNSSSADSHQSHQNHKNDKNDEDVCNSDNINKDNQNNNDDDDNSDPTYKFARKILIEHIITTNQNDKRNSHLAFPTSSGFSISTTVHPIAARAFLWGRDRRLSDDGDDNDDDDDDCNCVELETKYQ